jgi:CHAT domain-containing protein/lipopolysaccharide biosynthesis regulator YciM
MKYLHTFVCAFLFYASSSFSQSVPTDTVVATRSFKTGVAFLAGQRYDSSLHYFQRALPAYEVNRDWLKAIICLNNISESQFGTSDYPAAEKSARRVLQLCSEKLSADHVQTGYANIVLGNVVMYTKNDVNAALSLYRQALETFKKNYGEAHPDVAKAYVTIAQTNAYFIGRWSMMIEYYTKALNILLKVYDKNHPDIAAVYNSLGLAYKEMQDYETSEKYLQKALAIFKATMGDKNLAVANCLGNIARIHRARKDYAKAIEYFEQVRRIHVDVYREKHPFVIMVYRGIGDVYTDMGNVPLAEQHYKKGIQIAETVLAKKHPVIAAISNDLSELFQLYEDAPKALAYAQQAIIANVVDFNNVDPKVNPLANAYYFEIREFIYALANKEHVFLKMYKKDKNIDHLKNALAAIAVNDQVIDEFGKYIQDHDDKVFRGAEAVALVYEAAVEICVELFKSTNEKRDLEKAFYFSEKSKAGILRDAISEVKAKNISHIPSDLLDVERNLKTSRSQYLSQIQQEKMKGPAADEKTIATASDKLFALGRKYDSLVDVFEKQYPQYYTLKFQNRIIGVSQIQRQLDDGTAVLEYFIGKTGAYQFLITKNDFQYSMMEPGSSLEEHVTNLRNALNPLNKMAKDSSFQMYAHEARVLFNHTLKDILKYAPTCDNLVVIPDRQLNYLPFDVFLTENVPAAADYRNLPYLINRYTISYAYSASILFNKTERKATNASPRLIAFAPVYNPTEGGNTIAHDDNFRSKLTSLTWNQKEVESIGAMMNGVSLVGPNAVERKFKESATDFTIIHLAMHARIDDDRPMYSHLAFSMEPDSTEDNMLNAHELYNMDLSAELVVLSACETGYGKFESGEGIMSLAHAFTFAGCPSIVMSHWVVDDQATADIMRLFYTNLDKGLNKAEALRKAKLDFLKQADDIRKSPGLWSSFVVLGDRSPISQGSFFAEVWPYAVSAFVLLLSGIWIRHRRMRRAVKREEAKEELFQSR